MGVAAEASAVGASEVSAAAAEEASAVGAHRVDGSCYNKEKVILNL